MNCTFITLWVMCLIKFGGLTGWLEIRATLSPQWSHWVRTQCSVSYVRSRFHLGSPSGMGRNRRKQEQWQDRMKRKWRPLGNVRHGSSKLKNRIYTHRHTSSIWLAFLFSFLILDPIVTLSWFWASGTSHATPPRLSLFHKCTSIKTF